MSFQKYSEAMENLRNRIENRLVPKGRAHRRLVKEPRPPAAENPWRTDFSIRLQVMFAGLGYEEMVRYSLVGVTFISDDGSVTTSRVPKANNAKMAVTTNKPLKIAIHWLSPLHHKGSVSLIRMKVWKEGVCLREYLFPEPSSNGDWKEVLPWWNTCRCSAPRLLVPRLLAKTSARWNRAWP
jgi:hypothetical protein